MFVSAFEREIVIFDWIARCWITDFRWCASRRLWGHYIVTAGNQSTSWRCPSSNGRGAALAANVIRLTGWTIEGLISSAPVSVSISSLRSPRLRGLAREVASHT